ncbi:metal-dependent hydrolase [Aquabacterium sp.]|uniref:metal-dependent hydrolase n=1 Tax=Aquabacterium sp. TaxID=1872578 RepID=UPI0025BCC5D9|nr:metal-dependent hydrolase [Aquabacterium sp.]
MPENLSQNTHQHGREQTQASAAHVAQHPIIPRERLQFKLDADDIPTYWMGGDAFQSRFWDALSIIFPPGEKYFMNCVRDYRDQITDPKLLQDIKDFNRQEAQHSMVHRQDNDRLRKQGVDVDRWGAYVDNMLNKEYRGKYSKAYNLAVTSALEHFTSIIAHSLFDKRDVMKAAHPHVRAMYAWHAIEEVEHKGVAYDVMEDYAKVGYLMRVWALVHATFMFPATIFTIQRALFIHDGFSAWQRAKLMAKGMVWLFKPGGLLQPMLKAYWTYYKPGYHPWQETEQPGYEHWLAAFNASGDPLKASEQTRSAMALV